uniref:Secreted protein n=1 Tax=Oryza punctata TaxID=4537 RepID=A0A0E0KRL9_ORYPU
MMLMLLCLSSSLMEIFRAFSRCDTTCSMDGRCFLCPVHERASFKLRSNASVEYSPFSLGSANSNTLCALLLRWHEIETTPTITTAMRHPSSISYPADNSQEQKKERIIRERAESLLANDDKPLPAKRKERQPNAIGMEEGRGACSAGIDYCNRNGGRERSVRLRGRDSGCPITHSDHLPISPPHGGIFSMGW